MKGCKYMSFAIGQDEKRVHVDEANKGDLYYCVSCGEAIILRKGKIRRAHFAHKVNTENCSYETYLHKLAKDRIYHWFYSEEPMNLKIEVQYTCSAECRFKRHEPCKWWESKTFNLKDWYDTCTVEASIEGYKADLLLSNSQYPDRQPVLIEIYVHHKCTHEKIKSNLRIIELNINSEEDIQEYINQKCITVDNPKQYGNGMDWKSRAYNFNTDKKGIPSQHYQRPTYLFSIDKYLDTFINKQYSRCLSQTKNYQNRYIFTIETIEYPDYEECMRLTVRTGLSIRFCTMCRFRKESSSFEKICVLYKKCGLVKSPRIKSALSCQHFKMKEFGIRYNNRWSDVIETLYLDISKDRKLLDDLKIRAMQKEDEIRRQRQAEETRKEEELQREKNVIQKQSVTYQILETQNIEVESQRKCSLAENSQPRPFVVDKERTSPVNENPMMHLNPYARSKNRSCFNCMKNRDFESIKDGQPHCGMFQILNIPENTPPETAQNCEYFSYKFC